jgi:hypothetical protein
MNPYSQYRKARMEFNHLRKYIRLCYAWANDQNNYKIMVNAGWESIVDSEVGSAKIQMDTLRQQMESVDPDGVYRVRFEKEMKRGK